MHPSGVLSPGLRGQGGVPPPLPGGAAATQGCSPPGTERPWPAQAQPPGAGAPLAGPPLGPRQGGDRRPAQTTALAGGRLHGRLSQAGVCVCAATVSPRPGIPTAEAEVPAHTPQLIRTPSPFTAAVVTMPNLVLTASGYQVAGSVLSALPKASEQIQEVGATISMQQREERGSVTGPPGTPPHPREPQPTEQLQCTEGFYVTDEETEETRAEVTCPRAPNYLHRRPLSY